MKEFMDKDFLLETETARHLFHDYAEHMPLVDYHCHINPKEIYEDRRFDNLAEVWLGGKQPDEDYITGDRPDYERFLKFVEALEMAIGNPMYHWCNLELRQFFGYDKPLTVENAEEAWNFCNEKLRTDPDLTVRGIIKKANVAFIGTTDDPVDTLEWHGRIASDESIGVKVCPSFRPDKAINIQKEGFAEYIGKLAQSVGKETLDTAQEVMEALVLRLEYFKTRSRKVSDGCSAMPGPGLPPTRDCHADPLLLLSQRKRTHVPETGPRYRFRHDCTEYLRRRHCPFPLRTGCDRRAAEDDPLFSQPGGQRAARHNARLLPVR